MPSNQRFPSPLCPHSLLSRVVRRSVLCCALSLSLSNAAIAAALGDATVRSSLGQELNIDIALASLSVNESDTLLVRLAPAATYVDAGIDYTPLMRSLRVYVEKRNELHVVRVTSDIPVNDPFVRLLIEMSARGSRTIREYTLLLDPPVIEASERKVAVNPAAVSAPPMAAATVTAATAATEATEATEAATGAATAPSQPAAGAQASGPVQAKAAATRVVRRGDTLHSIATSLLNKDVRIEQALVALQNANPSAFSGGNINRLKRGSVLRLPDAEAIRAIDPAQARRAIRTQAANFSRHQRLLAQRAAAASAPASQPATAGNRSSSAQVGMRMDEPSPPAEAQDRLSLSVPGRNERVDGKASPVDSLDKIAAENALADANSRIAALEKNIGQLNRMLEFRNGNLADVQQNAAQSQAPAADAPRPPKPMNEPSVPDSTSAPAAPLEPIATDALVVPDTPPPSDAPAPSAASDALSSDAAAPAEFPPARQLPTPAPGSVPLPARMPMLEQLLGDARARAAAALLLLPLLAWAGLRWRRRRTQLSGEPAIEPVLEHTVIAGAGGRHIDTRHSEFHSNFVPSVSQIDANEVDAVAEADVYIAYGRAEQAEEILLDALRTHPQRDALRVKLLEIYAARKDKQKFGALAAELRVLTHGTGHDWDQAAQLGRLFDPGNRLFEVPHQPGAAQPGAAAATLDFTAAGRPAATGHEAAKPSPVEDFGMRLEGRLDERRHEAVAPAPPRDPQQSSAIDFSLGAIGAGSKPAAARADEAALNTKLELAQACQEIGDREGARELLAEVARSGHPELAQRAQSLLR